MKTLLNAKKKLKEADYFLTLLSSVCMNHRSIISDIPFKIWNKQGVVPNPDLLDEVSYLFSAFTNACYSIISYFKEDPVTKVMALEFRKKHFICYGNKVTGGYRTRAVHFHPVIPKDVGWKEHTEQEKKAWDSLDEFLGPGEVTELSQMPEEMIPKIYLEKHEPQRAIELLCCDHLMEVMELVNQVELHIKSNRS
jgi:hypothetical protein